MSLNSKKIFILVLPATGHINPVSGLAHELVNKKNCQVYFYGGEEHKTVIESTGAQFRLYEHYPIDTFRHPTIDKDRNDPVKDFYTKLINISYKQVPALLKDVERDRPDLIILDDFSFPAKYLIKIMQKNYKKGLSQTPPPPVINFYSCFPLKPNVYPNAEETKLLAYQDFWVYFSIFYVIIKQIIFSLRFGIDVYNPLNFSYNQSEELNIVSVLPEIQPRRDQFESRFQFVGPCISEKVRKFETTNPGLKQILENFSRMNPIEPKSLEQVFSDRKLKLIYVSLGTVFNNNSFIFDSILENFKLFTKEEVNFRVVMALGKDIYAKYEQKIQRGDLVLPENVLLVPFAPQIEILERASLFITHAGMNSASEAIHYGVPVICIPIQGDQPFVAYRLADELNLGIRLDPLKLKPIELKNAIQKILADRSYVERMLKFSDISRKSTGNASSARLVLEFLESKEKKSN